MHFQAWLDILELEPKIMYCDYRSKWTCISIFDGQLDTKEREREGGRGVGPKIDSKHKWHASFARSSLRTTLMTPPV